MAVRVARGIRVCRLIICLLVLIARLITFDSKPDGDFALGMIMLFLTFPLGVAGGWFASWAFAFLHLDAPITPVVSVAEWKRLFFPATFQWFVLPGWFRKILAPPDYSK